MKDELTPVRMAVMLAVGAVIIALIGALAIGGSYWLTLHTLNVAKANQIKSSQQICKALRVLDEAHDGITFPAINAAHPSEEALTRIFQGDHEVYLTSGCPELLNR